jgi:hypothetical protein
MVIIMFTLSISSFAYIEDKIKFLKQDELEVMQKRVSALKRDYEIDFKIIISEKEEIIEKNLNNTLKSVIINIVKKEQNKFKIKLQFSQDIDVVAYKTDINEMLDKVESLLKDDYYLDLIYELTGNIADLINVSEFEKKQAIGGTLYKKLKGVFLSLFILSFTITITLYILKYVGKKSRKCKHCNIDMAVTHEYEEGNKKIRVYTCTMCGYSKRIISIKK